LVVRAVARLNGNLHVILCQIHEVLRSLLYVFPRAANLIDPIVQTLSNIGSDLLSRFWRKEQGSYGTDTYTQNKRYDWSWLICSGHHESPLKANVIRSSKRFNF
jgi:hypothetical protein